MARLPVPLSVIRLALQWLVPHWELVWVAWLGMVWQGLLNSRNNTSNSQVFISRQQTTHSVHPDITVHQWPQYARKVIRVHLQVNSGDIG